DLRSGALATSQNTPGRRPALQRLTVEAPRPAAHQSPQGRNVYSISASKAPAPAGRNVPGMLVRATPRNHAPSISRRWGWGLRSTLSYKHCVPLGLTLAANLFGLEFSKMDLCPAPK